MNPSPSVPGPLDLCAQLQAELTFLRSEMELNREYIFERPLVIVAGGITAAAGLQTLIGFDVLPIVFVTLMAYNLWSTFNRLQSNARIVSYLQVIHRRHRAHLWIGWEAALQEFRQFPARSPDRYALFRDRRRTPDEYSENRFYGPILTFHLVSALGITGFFLAQVYHMAFPSASSGPYR
jgi:hypothetical protein